MAEHAEWDYRSEQPGSESMCGQFVTAGSISCVHHREGEGGPKLILESPVYYTNILARGAERQSLPDRLYLVESGTIV